ncbi:MAG: carbohydrate binding family 9 domain-containing protein, partial [Dehalococcoidia bacterium]|nr:carbohydrate binding family 9 domain-containing protein [Dehalococcoidia bacterium]
MNKKYIIQLLVVVCVSSLASAQMTQTQKEKPVIETRDIGTFEIKLDGVLDEEVWRSVTPATGFIQEEPNEGEACTEKSEIYVIYNKDNLYIGAKLYDSDPSGILAYQKRRDAWLVTDDRFMLILDTFLDGRTGYFFEINPAGLLGDGILGSGGHWNVNKSWDGIWDTRVVIDDDGWTAEIVIPFRTLNFDPDLDTWGINFQRTIRRKNEDARWSGYRRNQNLTEPIHAGRVTGLKNLTQGKGLEVKPYVIAKNQWSSDGIPANPQDKGLDLSFNITSGLKGSFTYNTDFAEAEVDDRRVNLTRFPMRFREKRAFFLEGSGVYSFANRSGVTPFFSRRIGLSEGKQIPIVYGGRLTGQVGDYEIGMINAWTESLGNIPAENFNVARIKRSLFRESYLGLVYTGRSADTDSVYRDQDLLGIDLDLSTSRFKGDQNLKFQAFFVGHSSPKENPDAT